MSPILILFMIQMLQLWANSNFIWENLDPETREIPHIPRCYGEDCVTLAYVVNG